MSRQLYDLAFYCNGEFIDEITAGVDFDDEEAADLTLATHLARIVRDHGGDPSDLADCVVQIRRHGYQAVQMTFQTDLWVEE